MAPETDEPAATVPAAPPPTAPADAAPGDEEAAAGDRAGDIPFDQAAAEHENPALG